MSYPTPGMTWTSFVQGMNGMWPGKPKFVEKDYPSFKNKVVVITGGSDGLGFQTAKSLAGSTNARIYIFARNEEKTVHAIKRLQIEVAQKYNKHSVDVHFIKVDLGDLTTIKPAVENFLSQETRLDLIIHNAGIVTDKAKFETAQGYEAQLGTNTIGPHLLQKLLDPIFIKTSKSNKPKESRVVWVSSYAHFWSPLGGFNWDDPNSKHEKPSGRLYGQSKAVNVIQGLQWNSVHPEATGVVSVSLDPGYFKTKIIKNPTFIERFFIRMFWEPRYGAYTELFAAFSPAVTNGAHVIPFGKIGKIRNDIINNVPNQQKVWKWLDDQVEPYL